MLIAIQTMLFHCEPAGPVKQKKQQQQQQQKANNLEVYSFLE